MCLKGLDGSNKLLSIYLQSIRKILTILLHAALTGVFAYALTWAGIKLHNLVEDQNEKLPESWGTEITFYMGLFFAVLVLVGQSLRKFDRGSESKDL